MTPIEQLYYAEDISEFTDSPTVQRAVSLFTNMTKWGTRCRKGTLLKPADNLKNPLSADMDKDLYWNQYYRAATTVESLLKGSITFVDLDRHGRILVLHGHSETYSRVVGQSQTMSSVGATG